MFRPHRSPKLEDTTITFHEPTGAVIMMMDKKKAGQDFAKMHAVMGAMCECDAVTFSRMTGSDYKVCTAIAALFLD